MVLRRCRQLLRDEDEALDAAQDVFVRLIERRQRLDARYPSSLLYRIATNVCLNRIRDRTRRPETSDEEKLFAIARAEEPARRAMRECCSIGCSTGIPNRAGRWRSCTMSMA
jgi:RNA polymerase sigma-70 factor (ECF subfamily)